MDFFGISGELPSDSFSSIQDEELNPSFSQSRHRRTVMEYEDLASENEAPLGANFLPFGLKKRNNKADTKDHDKMTNDKSTKSARSPVGASAESAAIESKLVKAAKDGNLPKVISIVSSNKSDSSTTLEKLVNEARKRTHVDGYNRTLDWYDLTPLAAAALQGHARVVEYLIRQGADPTLIGSPLEEEQYDALEAAKKGQENLQTIIDFLVSIDNDELKRMIMVSSDHSSQFAESSPVQVLQCLTGVFDFHWKPSQTNDAQVFAKVIVEKQDQALLCEKLLAAILPYWNRASYYSSIYRKRNYTNQPKKKKTMLAAVDTVISQAAHDSNHVPHRKIAGRTAATSLSSEALLQQLTTKIEILMELVEKVQQKKNISDRGYSSRTENNDDTDQLTELRTVSNGRTRKNKTSGNSNSRRHSDSFCVSEPNIGPGLLRKTPSKQRRSCRLSLEPCVKYGI